MKDWIKRAIRTFVQAFCGAFSTGIVAAVMDKRSAGINGPFTLRCSLFCFFDGFPHSEAKSGMVSPYDFFHRFFLTPQDIF